MKLRFLLFAFVAACLPALLAVITTSELAVRATDTAERRLSSATAMIQARLDADAARRRELMLRVSVLDGVTQPVKEAAKAGESPAAVAVSAMRDAVRDLEPRDPPELLIVATAQGAQLVATSGEPRQLATSDVPLAAAALGGQQAEGFARFDGGLYRITAVPVGIAEGALIVGDRVADATASRLRELAKVQGVTIVLGTVPLASTYPADARTDFAKAAERRNATVTSGVTKLGLSGLAFLDGVFPLMVPTGETVSLATDIGGGAALVVTVGSAEEVAALGRIQIFALGMLLGLLVLAGAFTLFIFAPLERQARSLEAHLVRMRAEHSARLGTKGFTHPFLEVVQEIDRLAGAIEREGLAPREKPEATPPAPSADPKPIQRPPLELPLQTAPEPAVPQDVNEGTPSAFPFQDDPVATRTGPIGRAKDLQGAKMPLPPAPSIPSIPSMPTSVPKPAPRAETKTEVKPVARPEPVKNPLLESLEEAMPTAEGLLPIPLPGARPAGGAPPRADPFAAFGPPPETDLSDRTREAAIPPELLARSRELEQELLDPPADPDEEHFRQVYEEFVAQRKKCGEPADGLTFDKFAARLKKNREQLVEKYACKTVRFQVYVKEGKAAVKAAPVR